MDVLLDVRISTPTSTTSAGVVRAVDGVSWDVRAGETVALVGESGCGKSVSALSVMRLVSAPAGRIVDGEILFNGRDLLALSEEEMRRVRGREIGMIFQEPMTSLNPVLTVGRQLTETVEIHLGMTHPEANARAVELLGLVGSPTGCDGCPSIPHQFSGGMRQRMMIAMALVLQSGPRPGRRAHHRARRDHPGPDPRADEEPVAPARRGHDDHHAQPGRRGRATRDRVNVMYAGKIVERATAREIYANPRHPYTLGLLRSVPRLDEPRRAKLQTDPGAAARSDSRLPAGCSFAPRCAYAIERLPRGGAAAGVGGRRPSRRVLAGQGPPRSRARGGRRSSPQGEEATTRAKSGLERSDEPAGRHERPSETILEVRNLVKHFHLGGGLFGGQSPRWSRRWTT